jgi:hypothetical protein
MMIFADFFFSFFFFVNSVDCSTCVDSGFRDGCNVRE